MRIGFIGLGNVGSKLAGSLMRNGFELTVRDLDRNLALPFLDDGASWANSPVDLARESDIVITCLPSPKISASVMEAKDGVLAGIRPGSLWAEMSTTDHSEVLRLGALVREKGGSPLDWSGFGWLPSCSDW